MQRYGQEPGEHPHSAGVSRGEGGQRTEEKTRLGCHGNGRGTQFLALLLDCFYTLYDIILVHNTFFLSSSTIFITL